MNLSTKAQWIFMECYCCDIISDKIITVTKYTVENITQKEVIKNAVATVGCNRISSLVKTCGELLCGCFDDVFSFITHLCDFHLNRHNLCKIASLKCSLCRAACGTA